MIHSFRHWLYILDQCEKGIHLTQQMHVNDVSIYQEFGWVVWYQAVKKFLTLVHFNNTFSTFINKQRLVATKTDSCNMIQHLLF